MEKNINLSYLVVTRNKLPYLKVTLEKLISQKKEDEDILVADGQSSDGTKEYLAELKSLGRIDFYLSEPDVSVAHAINKLILISKGSLLRFMADDDASHYQSINACKEFMMKHPEIDLVNTEGGVLGSNGKLKALTYVNTFKEYKKNHIPFSFCELGMILRRTSIPLIGLRDPVFKRADMEMSLRITSGMAKIAWYTGYSYVNIVTPQSASKTLAKEMASETDRLNKFYLGKNPDNFFVNKIKIIKNKVGMILFKKNNRMVELGSDWFSFLSSSEEWLEIKNKEITPEFIY
ncbi:MAG: glycosyltransferase family A protein [Candidatus Paceibacterota bacterium]|jgi:glycosyltransferase involved in cell wall biosynthesis